MPILVKSGTKSSSLFQALIDSGSDRNLFPAEFGEQIGLKVKKGIRAPIDGIGGVRIQAYTHKVYISIENYEFLVSVDFSYEQEMPLLGRLGFFDQFRSIEFRERRKIIEFTVS